MPNQTIVMSRSDATRLRAMLGTPDPSARDRDHHDELEAEIERARIMDGDALPADVVAVRTQVEVRDLAGGESRTLTLVWPPDSDPPAGRISVLAPLGIALLGHRTGDEIEWQMPGGLRRLRIERVMQPDRAGGRAKEAV